MCPGEQSGSSGLREHVVRGVSVLVADDDEHDPEGLRGALGDIPGISSSSGPETARSRSSPRAGSAVRFAILDLNMPHLDGVEAAPLLRRNRPSTRIAIHSSGSLRPPGARRPDLDWRFSTSWISTVCSLGSNGRFVTCPSGRRRPSPSSAPGAIAKQVRHRCVGSRKRPPKRWLAINYAARRSGAGCGGGAARPIRAGVIRRGRRTIRRSSGKTAATRRRETKRTVSPSETTRTSGRGGRPA